LRSAEQLAQTYAQSIRTRPVLAKAAAEVGLTSTFQDLLDRVKTRQVVNTQLLRISAEHTNPDVAAQLANTVAQVFVSKNEDLQAARFASSRDSLTQLVASLQLDVDAHLNQIHNLRAQPSSPERDAELARLQGELTQLESTHGESVRSLEDLRVVEARGMNTLTVIEPAVPPETPVRPNRMLVTLLAALTGLVLAAGAAGLADYLDDVLRDRQRVASAIGLSTLGVIPLGKAGTTLRDPYGRRLTENYRLLGSNLLVSVSRSDQLRTVLVASAGVGEGKSTTAANLAVALAESGRRVILVDADMHRPVQMQLFSVSNRLGLSTLLMDESQTPTAVEHPTWLPNLTVIPAGPLPLEPSALLSAHRADEVLAQLRELCDIVVIDTPPLLAQPDAALLGSRADGVLLVVDATKSRGRQAARALEMLQESGALVFGAVLNRIPKRSMDYPAYDSYYARPPEDASGSPADGGNDEPHGEPALKPSPQNALAHAASVRLGK
jgi:non-specific protein-tyrosine kinase